MACKNTHSTREGLGRCPKCGFSSGVSLLRPTHSTYCLSCCVEPHCTHPQSNHPFYPDAPPVRKHTRLALFPFTASNKDGTIEHIFEGLTLRKAFLVQKYNISLPTCDQPGNLALHPTLMDNSEERLEKVKQGNSKTKGRRRAKEQKGNSDNVLGGWDLG